jgi:hypothetical protein
LTLCARQVYQSRFAIYFFLFYASSSSSDDELFYLFQEGALGFAGPNSSEVPQWKTSEPAFLKAYRSRQELVLVIVLGRPARFELARAL